MPVGDNVGVADGTGVGVDVGTGVDVGSVGAAVHPAARRANPTNKVNRERLPIYRRRSSNNYLDA